MLRHQGAMVHREGRRPATIVCAIVVASTITVGSRVVKEARWNRLPTWTALVSLSVLAFVMQFFRHPGCSTPADDDLVVAPAYGRVVHIGVEEEPEVLGDRRVRVSIFLSVFDAHLTRAPVPGIVVYQRYHPGRYLLALHPKSSTLNERNSIVIEHPGGVRILVRQIAGLLARRICSYVRVGRALGAGEELGFIKLGSRVDLFLPESATVLVHTGQYVRAGETPVARLLLDTE